MPSLRHGNVEVDLLPFVEEAITTLGLVRPAAAQWLAQEVATNVNRKQGRSIREGGMPLSHEQRTALGLPKFGEQMSVEVWDALTAAGRDDPVQSFDDTVSRAIKLARNSAQTLAAASALRAGVFAGIKIGPPPGIGVCASGMAMVGKVLDAPPSLPFAGCDRRVCSCGWRLVSSWEFDRTSCETRD